jgi:pimeloyl-ACP methyl ester carboxylesterase
MLTVKTFDAGDVVISYAEGESAGPPLVLLHGSTLNWQTLGDYISWLGQNWHVYACDLRGQGNWSFVLCPWSYVLRRSSR